MKWSNNSLVFKRDSRGFSTWRLETWKLWTKSSNFFSLFPVRFSWKFSQRRTKRNFLEKLFFPNQNPWRYSRILFALFLTNQRLWLIGNDWSRKSRENGLDHSIPALERPRLLKLQTKVNKTSIRFPLDFDGGWSLMNKISSDQRGKGITGKLHANSRRQRWLVSKR